MTCKYISANSKEQTSFSFNEAYFWTLHLSFWTLEQPNILLVKQPLAAIKITEAKQPFIGVSEKKLKVKK